MKRIIAAGVLMVGLIAGCATSPATPTPAVATPPPAPSVTIASTPPSAPEIVCTVGEVDCQAAIELVRSKAPEDVALADTIVVADICAPDVTCDRKWPFHSVVALARDGSLVAVYEVTGTSGPEAVGARQVGGVPPHVEELIQDASRN